MTANEYGVSFWADENVLELVVMVAQLYEYTATILDTLKRINFVVCE